MRLVVAAIALAGCSDHAAEPPAAPRNSFETFDATSPRVGETAPSFALQDTTGATVKLEDVVAKGPVVLVSGSFSCPLFRMKTPRFEDLARRWEGKATVLFVYSEEAHPRAASSARLNGFADQVRALDKDGDGAVTLAEYGNFGPRYMFDAFDVDHDGVIQPHEIIAAKRIDQFRDIEAPRTLDERIALARRFRTEVPGKIRVLIDPIDNPTTKIYGEFPNFAYVIGTDGRVAFKQGWAAAPDVERELRRLLGGTAPAPATTPDVSLLARHGTKPVLAEFVAPGCAACVRMDETLADPAVQHELAGFDVVRLGVDQDPAWRLFEDLELAATPAFIKVAADGSLQHRLQGATSRDAFVAFLHAD
jgi:thiol-disulfide isomerase/thioredoxin